MKKQFEIAVLVTVLVLSTMPMVVVPVTADDVLFFDDFEDGNADGWKIYAPGGQPTEYGWSVESEEGNYVLNGEGHYHANPKGIACSDYVFETKLKRIEKGIHLKVRQSENGRYFIRFYPREVTLSKTVGGAHFDLFRSDAGIIHNKWYTVKIVCVGNNIKVYVDDILKIGYTDNDNPHLYGHIGFETLDNSHAHVDDVKVVSAAVAPTPVASTPSVTPISTPVATPTSTSAMAASNQFWIDRGNAYMEGGRYQDAIDAFNKAIEMDSNSADAWMNKADALNCLGRYQDALDAIDKVIELNPNNSDALTLKGCLLVDFGRCQDALDAIDKAIELNPNNLDAWLHKRCIIDCLGKREEAIATSQKIIDMCDKLIAVNPNDNAAWEYKGNELNFLGEYEDALIALNKAIEIDPNNPHIWHVKGETLFALERYQEAVDAYDKATKLNPNLPHFLVDKGKALDALGKHDEADEAYDKAFEIVASNTASTFTPAPTAVPKPSPPSGIPQELPREYPEMYFIVPLIGILVFIVVLVSIKYKGGIGKEKKETIESTPVLEQPVSPIHGEQKEQSRKIIGHEVFICHSSEDKPVADAMCGIIESKGIKCWIAPRDILPGVNYQEALIDAIDGSQIMTLIFSSRSNNSPHVIRELTEAFSKGVIIIPFRIEDVPLSKSMKYLVGLPHWLDALTPPLEQHLEKLAETIRLLLNQNKKDKQGK